MRSSRNREKKATANLPKLGDSDARLAAGKSHSRFTQADERRSRVVWKGDALARWKCQLGKALLACSFPISPTIFVLSDSCFLSFQQLESGLYRIYLCLIMWTDLISLWVEQQFHSLWWTLDTNGKRSCNKKMEAWSIITVVKSWGETSHSLIFRLKIKCNSTRYHSNTSQRSYILVEILEDGACNICTISITRSTLIMRDHMIPMRRIWVAVHPAYHGMNQFAGLNSNDGQLRRASLATGLHTPYVQKYQPWRSKGTRTRSLSDQLVTDLHQSQHISY
jgi:hypothetical protein